MQRESPNSIADSVDGALVDVAIIGGGYSGVSALATFKRFDPSMKVVLFEAENHLGGRAYTRNGLDLGAHYFGAQHRRLYELAERLVPHDLFNRASVYGANPAQRALLSGRWTLTTRQESFFDLQGLTKDCPPSEWAMIFRSIAEYVALESRVNLGAPWLTPDAHRLDSISFAEWIDGQVLVPWLREMWEFAALGIISAHARDISMLYWLWYTASNGGFLRMANDYEGGPQEFSVRCGLGGLLQRWADSLGADVRMSTPVVRVEQRADRVFLHTESGQRIESKHLIVAAAPATVGRYMTFEPALSPGRQLLNQQKMGHAKKAVFVYSEPFWRQSHGLHFYGYMGGPSTRTIEWALDTSRADGSEYTLMAFVSDRMNDDEASLRQALVELTDDPRAANFIRMERHDWGKQSYVGGGPNTVFAKGVISRLDGVLDKPEGRVWFASAEQSIEFTGYVEGAILSGERAASAILGKPLRSAPGGQWKRKLVGAGASIARGALTPIVQGWAMKQWLRT